ncbi:MFS transporter [Methanoregula sp.]|uniref:MFS transporter n=1 Tax=Methanoregula sp. TaxID=2052170 RepID=UPI00236D2074|nr:MFS transporter [Methanoregula sp.]MDD1687709.1 MFS transporter [Methanoregula sp.]
MSTVIMDPLRQKLLLGAVALGVVMDGIDGSIVNVALPTMATYFSTDTGTIAWVIITYLLMMAGLLLVFGKLADRGLAKRLFLLGFIIFTISSAACGIAPSLDTLLAARIVQGIGAAMIAAVAPLLCIRYLPKEMLGTALGVIAATASIGFAAGPAIGGILTQHLSWHWIFLVNIPIGIIGILFAARVIPADEPGMGDRTSSFDYPGAVLLFGAMVFCTFVLEEGAARGVSDPLILICGIVCLLCSGLFVARELAIPEPFVNIRIFSGWQFTSVTTAYLLVNVIFMGVLYLLPFYLTMEMHFDLMTSGLCLLIPPAVIAILSIPFGKWSDRYGRRAFAVAACGFVVLYSAIFAFISPGSGIVPLLAGLIVMGVAFGIAAGPAASRIIESAPRGEEGTGSSLMVTAIYFGGVLGTAIYAALFTFATMDTGAVVAFTDLDPATFLDGFHITMVAGIVLSLVTVVLSAIVPDEKKTA